jgi:hypothetical protein
MLDSVPRHSCDHLPDAVWQPAGSLVLVRHSLLHLAGAGAISGHYPKTLWPHLPEYPRDCWLLRVDPRNLALDLGVVVSLKRSRVVVAHATVEIAVACPIFYFKIES